MDYISLTEKEIPEEKKRRKEIGLLKARVNTIRKKLAGGKKLDREATREAVSRDIKPGTGIFSEEVPRELVAKNVLNGTDIEAKKALKSMEDISCPEIQCIKRSYT